MRILCIDYGRKNVGIAVTDPLQLIVNGLTTVSTTNLTGFLRDYFSTEDVSKVVLGYPTHKDGTPTDLVKDIEFFQNWLVKNYPAIQIDYQDEYLSSSMAIEKMNMVKGKKDASRDPGLIDQMSAVIILQQYLGHI